MRAPELDPKYSSLERMNKWDDNTREEIKKRIQKEIGVGNRFSFLGERESQLLLALTDIFIPQSHDENYVKIAEAVDNTLSDKKTGVRYNDNPWKGEFYKQGLKILTAQCPKEELLEEFVQAILEKPDGFLKKFLRRVLSDSVAIYYSHPKAWDKIGFPGPAFPIGYFLLDCEDKEKWEPDYFKKTHEQ